MLYIYYNIIAANSSGPGRQLQARGSGVTWNRTLVAAIAKLTKLLNSGFERPAVCLGLACSAAQCGVGWWAGYL